MRGQPGFFDIDDRLKRLSGLGDQLETFRSAVSRQKRREARGKREARGASFPGTLCTQHNASRSSPR